MKTNIINSNSVKTFICTIVLMLGFSVSAWGTGTITPGIASKTINIEGETADGSFSFSVSSSGLTNDNIYYYLGVGTSVVTDDDTYEYDCGFGSIGTYTINSTSGTIYVSYKLYDEGTYNFDVQIHGYEAGTQNYIQVDVPVTITVAKGCTSQDVLVADEDTETSQTGSYGTLTSFDLDVAPNGSGDITWTSTNTSVATVSGDNDGATITVVGAGTTTIKASVAADATYCAGVGEYSLTINPIAPTLSYNTSGKELTVSSITSTGATFSGGVVTNKGGLDISQYGFIIGTSATVVVGGTGANAPVAGSVWNEDININTAFGSKTATSSFSPNTTYYVRAFATNDPDKKERYSYSSAVEFTTLQRYAVTYYKNDGGATSEVEYKDHGVNYTVSSDKFSRDHYTLSKWHTLAAGTGGTDYAKGATYSTNAALNLYAVWTLENHTISFNANGGSGSMDNVVKAYNTTYNLPACTFSQPAGKVFDHWGEGSSSGTSRAVGYTLTVTGDITYYAVWRDATYTNYTFACAELELAEPENKDTMSVVRDTVYLTSTSGQKVRSMAKFHVTGTGLTASKEVKFTTGDDDLDAVFSFKKGDGTAVSTDASGEVNEDVYIFYQPTETSDGRDVITAVGGIRAYVERNADGGKPRSTKNTDRTISGRHLPSQFIIAAKSGGVWYALPSDASVTGAQMGYTFTPDNATTPTKATVAPQTALYSIYAPRADGTNKSYVRFATTTEDNTGKTLWSNNSTSKIGIKDNAAVNGTSAKGDQYEWRLESTGKDTYKLYNKASYGNAGRYLGLSGTKWNVFATNVSIVQDLKILPVDDVASYIGLSATNWEETAFSFSISSGTPPTAPSLHHIQVGYNGKNYDASISGSKLTITDDDFVTDGGFAAASGSQLLVEWCNNSNAVLAQGSVISPIIINSNTVNLSDYDADALKGTDIFITNGAKLTINENTTVHDLTVNSGATLFVNETAGGDGVTLNLSDGKLELKGGWNSAETDYDMPRVYINPLSSLAKTNTTINFDISVDKRNYYPFAVPFEVEVKDVDYVNPTLAGASVYGTHYVIKEYNGAGRAEYGSRDENWVVVSNAAGTKLQPGKGYILTAVSIPTFGGGVIRFPMKNVPNAWTTLGEQGSVTSGLTTTTKNVIEVTAHEGTATSGGGANNRHKGWNMLGVPFMSCYTSGTDMYDGEGSADLMEGRMTLSGDPADPYGWDSESDVVYVSVPTHDFSEYIQTDITSAKLVPGWSFFIQVGTTGNLTFLTTKQREDSDMPIYAPTREASPIVKTGIVLTGGEKSDQTTLIISDRYSTEYEIGADLEKMFGNGYTLATYSITGGMQLAFNAMSTTDARQVIPIGFRAPEDGEYTFSLNPRYADAAVERVDLIDYQTGEVTNLMMSEYTFTTVRTQDDERFALNVVPRAEVPTGVEDNSQKSKVESRKLIIDDHVFIIHDGLLYDATGKRVKQINK